MLRQDKLWEEMEGKEKRGKKAQQAAKKNKKVRTQRFRVRFSKKKVVCFILRL